MNLIKFVEGFDRGLLKLLPGSNTARGKLRKVTQLKE
jgi:hypothetical protein